MVGNQLQTADGKAVWLQGVNIPSLEWSLKGENVLRSVSVAIDDWKANVIRLPIRDDHWSGRNPGPKDGGKAYRELVDEAVKAIAARSAYVVIDLHRFRAPKTETVEFWKEVATQYRNQPAVLFDIFNEPHGISWEVWRDGGEVREKLKDGSVGTYESPGLQRLVDTVREAGARNIVIAGGLDWAYDLSGVAKGFTLEGKGGNGIMYKSHIYPWKRNWKDKVLVVAEKYPILLGECGADIKPMSFIPLSAQEDPYTWAPDLIGFVQKHRLHWTAWSFHPKASPRILEDWEYRPTPFWGAFVRAALRGAKFEMNRLR